MCECVCVCECMCVCVCVCVCEHVCECVCVCVCVCKEKWLRRVSLIFYPQTHRKQWWWLGGLVGAARTRVCV